MTTMSVRLSPGENSHILKWARQQKKDKSQAVRELLEFGWKFSLLERYHEGKISLGFLAKEMDCPVAEAMDFVSTHGAPTQLDFEDYRQGLENARKSL